MIFKMDTRDLLSILYFIVLDMIAFVGVPMIACCLSGLAAYIYHFDNGSEVLVLLPLVALLTAAYTLIIEKSMEYSNQTGAHTHRWTIFIILLLMNVTWTSVSILSLVRTPNEFSNKQVTSTRFGCFLASALFSMSKFSGYIYLFFLIVTEAIPT